MTELRTILTTLRSVDSRMDGIAKQLDRPVRGPWTSLSGLRSAEADLSAAAAGLRELGYGGSAVDVTAVRNRIDLLAGLAQSRTRGKVIACANLSPMLDRFDLAHGREAMHRSAEQVHEFHTQSAGGFHLNTVTGIDRASIMGEWASHGVAIDLRAAKEEYLPTARTKLQRAISDVERAYLVSLNDGGGVVPDARRAVRSATEVESVFGKIAAEDVPDIDLREVLTAAGSIREDAHARLQLIGNDAVAVHGTAETPDRPLLGGLDVARLLARSRTLDMDTALELRGAVGRIDHPAARQLAADAAQVAVRRSDLVDQLAAVGDSTRRAALVEPGAQIDIGVLDPSVHALNDAIGSFNRTLARLDDVDRERYGDAARLLAATREGGTSLEKMVGLGRDRGFWDGKWPPRGKVADFTTDDLRAFLDDARVDRIEARTDDVAMHVASFPTWTRNDAQRAQVYTDIGVTDLGVPDEVADRAMNALTRSGEARRQFDAEIDLLVDAIDGGAIGIDPSRATAMLTELRASNSAAEEATVELRALRDRLVPG